MNNLTLKDILAWITTVLPFLLQVAGYDPNQIMPLLAELIASGGALWVMYNRVADKIKAEGAKGFLASGTVQTGLIALLTVWLGYFNVDANTAITTVQGVILALTTLFGLINKARSTKAITGLA